MIGGIGHSVWGVEGVAKLASHVHSDLEGEDSWGG